jgi:hypothetical protein
MTPPHDLNALYTVMCLGGGLVIVSAAGLAMLGPEKSTANKKTIRRGPLPVAAPKAPKPSARCYGTDRRWVECQREWKLAHAPAPVQPAPPSTSAAEDVFVHWFENCVEISANNVISYDDLDASYLAYCQEQQATALAPEDFVRILASYSTSQGCEFDPNTGELTHGRLKS